MPQFDFYFFIFQTFWVIVLLFLIFKRFSFVFNFPISSSRCFSFLRCINKLELRVLYMKDPEKEEFEDSLKFSSEFRGDKDVFSKENFSSFLKKLGLFFPTKESLPFLNEGYLFLYNFINKFSQKYYTVEKILKGPGSLEEKQLLIEKAFSFIQYRVMYQKVNPRFFFPRTSCLVKLLDDVFSSLKKVDDLGKLRIRVCEKVLADKSGVFKEEPFNFAPEALVLKIKDYKKVLKKKNRSFKEYRNSIRFLLLFHCLKALEISLGLIIISIISKIYFFFVIENTENITREDILSQISAGSFLRDKKHNKSFVVLQRQFFEFFLLSFNQALSLLEEYEVIKILASLNKKRLQLLKEITKSESLRFEKEDIMFLISMLDTPFVLEKVGSLYFIFWRGQHFLNSIFAEEDAEDVLFAFSGIVFSLLEELKIFSLTTETHKPFVKVNTVEFNLNYLEIFTDVFSLIDKPSFPMIIPPQEWVLTNKALILTSQGYVTKKEVDSTFVGVKSLNLSLEVDSFKNIIYHDILRGGFLTNTLNFSSGVKNYGGVEFVDISHSTLNFLNCLQSTRFEYDVSYISYIENNFCNSILTYMDLLDVPSTFTIFFITLGPSLSLKVKSKTDFKKHFGSLFVEEDYLNVEYLRQFSLLLSFMSMFFSARLFQDFPAYFPVSMDKRGRVYPAVNSSFHYQGSKFVQAFLKVPCNCDLKNVSLDNNTNTFSLFLKNKEHLVSVNVDALTRYLSLQENSWLKDSYKTSQSFFHKKFLQLKLQIPFLSFTPQYRYLLDLNVSFDVTGSGFQIFGALVGDISLLIETNFLYVSHFPDEKKDIYMYIYEGFLPLLKESTSIFYYIKKEPNVFFAEVSLRALNILRTEVDRKFIKSILMPFLYSQGVESRAETLYTFLMKFEFDLSKRSILSEEERQLLRKAVKKVSLTVSHFFVTYFCEKFPEVGFVKSFLEGNFIKNNKILKSYKGFFLKISDNPDDSVFYISCLNLKEKKFRFFSNSLNRNSTLNISQLPRKLLDFEFDSRKASRSIVPHFIHRIDSELLRVWVLKLKDKGINVATRHDCVVTNIFFLEEVKKAYFESFIEVIIKTDILKLFIDTNSYSSPLTLKDMLKLSRFTNNRDEILRGIKQGLYKMSDFILTP